MTTHNQLTPSEQISYTTVKISTLSAGALQGTGTGFFFGVDHGNGFSTMLLVTNKHVLAGADEVVIRLHVCKQSPDIGPSGEVVQWHIKTSQLLSFEHPRPDIDLCALNISGVLEQAKESGKPVFLMALSSAQIPKTEDWENFDAIEDVLMAGCPRGIFDEVNNIPIVRKGISATPLNKQYNGKNQFVVDMACFPGSSGSPIFVYNRDGFLDRRANTYMMGATRFFLVGILFAGPLITNRGDIVFNTHPTVEVATTMHLGNAIRSSELLDLERAVRAHGVHRGDQRH